MAAVSEVFECQCHVHEIHAAADGDWGIELCFWEYGVHRGYDLRYRLRHIWKVLRTGTPYSDLVILDVTEAARLGDWLTTTAARQAGAQAVSKHGKTLKKLADL